MIKVAANQMDYQAATALYTRSLGLIKTALGRGSGRGAMDFLKSITIAASGLRAQAGRMRIISENIANAEFDRAAARRRSLSAQDPDLPCRDGPRPGRADGAIGRVRTDRASSAPKYQPGHPAADANGNVKYPNVNSLVEMTDMREAQRSYEANVNVISATRRMIQRTLEILKA